MIFVCEMVAVWLTWLSFGKLTFHMWTYGRIIKCFFLGWPVERKTKPLRRGSLVWRVARNTAVPSLSPCTSGPAGLPLCCGGLSAFPSPTRSLEPRTQPDDLASPPATPPPPTLRPCSACSKGLDRFDVSGGARGRGYLGVPGPVTLGLALKHSEPQTGLYLHYISLLSNLFWHLAHMGANPRLLLVNIYKLSMGQVSLCNTKGVINSD